MLSAPVRNLHNKQEVDSIQQKREGFTFSKLCRNLLNGLSEESPKSMTAVAIATSPLRALSALSRIANCPLLSGVRPPHRIHRFVRFSRIFRSSPQQPICRSSSYYFFIRRLTQIGLSLSHLCLLGVRKHRINASQRTFTDFG